MNMAKNEDSQSAAQRRERWTKEEHESFLQALHLFGRDWARASEYIGSKSTEQVRMHAYSHFARIQNGSKGALTQGTMARQHYPSAMLMDANRGYGPPTMLREMMMTGSMDGGRVSGSMMNPQIGPQMPQPRYGLPVTSGMSHGGMMEYSDRAYMYPSQFMMHNFMPYPRHTGQPTDGSGVSSDPDAQGPPTKNRPKEKRARELDLAQERADADEEYRVEDDEDAEDDSEYDGNSSDQRTPQKTKDTTARERRARKGNASNMGDADEQEANAPSARNNKASDKKDVPPKRPRFEERGRDKTRRGEYSDHYETENSRDKHAEGTPAPGRSENGQQQPVIAPRTSAYQQIMDSLSINSGDSVSPSDLQRLLQLQQLHARGVSGMHPMMLTPEPMDPLDGYHYMHGGYSHGGMAPQLADMLRARSQVGMGQYMSAVPQMDPVHCLPRQAIGPEHMRRPSLGPSPRHAHPMASAHPMHSWGAHVGGSEGLGRQVPALWGMGMGVGMPDEALAYGAGNMPEGPPHTMSRPAQHPSPLAGSRVSQGNYSIQANTVSTTGGMSTHNLDPKPLKDKSDQNRSVGLASAQAAFARDAEAVNSGDHSMDELPERRRRERWTQDEHELFLKGLELFGRKWTKIQAMVPNKTVTQVRTHAYGYFAKLLRRVPNDKDLLEVAHIMSSMRKNKHEDDDEEVSSAEAYVETSSTAGAGGKERRAVKPKARTSSLSIERDDAITTQSSKHEKQTRRRDVSYTDEADYGEELDEDDDEIETAEEQRALEAIRNIIRLQPKTEPDNSVPKAES